MADLDEQRQQRSGLARLVRFVAPHGLVLRMRRRTSPRRADPDYERALREVSGRVGDAHQFDYEDAVSFAQGLGVPENHVRGGSVPRDSVEFIVATLQDTLPADRATIGLHVGNYVGVSLVAIAAAERARHPESLVIGVDPNLPHRGTAQNQDRVCKLVDRYGLGKNVMLMCGYSGDKAPSNNGWVIAGYDPIARFDEEAAPRATLRNLARLLPGAADWAMLDGNHDGDYLRGDLASLARLVRAGGLVLLDDCTSAWPAIQRAFAETAATSAHWTAIGSNGRVGVLQRTRDA